MITKEEYFDILSRGGIKLNPQQRSAVEDEGRAILLLAVPGSGKTTTLVCRIGYLIYCKGLAAENILTMTYTRAAAADMKKRFVSLFGDEFGESLRFSTINSVCYSIINYYTGKYGRAGFEIATDTSKMLRDIYSRLNGSEYLDDSGLKDFKQKITYVKNMLLPREELEKIQLDGKEFASLYDEYIRQMKAQGLMDFDDQMVYARKILMDYPDILRYYQNKYKYICVDEAQDTSKIQHSIIRLLCSDGSKLFMVGDEDQSIYGFRAAYPDGILNFTQTYRDGKILKLETNYRSTSNIVEFANRFIRQNKQRHDKNMVALRGGGKNVQRGKLNMRKGQYQYISMVREKSPDVQTAVLYRNNASAIPLVNRLDKNGISFRFSKGDADEKATGEFFTGRAVSAVCRYMTLALDPLNANAFMNIYYMFGLRITKKQAQQAVNLCSTGDFDSIITALIVAGDFSESTLTRLNTLKANFAALKTDSAGMALTRIRFYMGLNAYASDHGFGMDLLYILSVIASEEKDIYAFAKRLEDLKTLIGSGGDKNSNLILSTIHGSKGLEYDRVIVIDAVDGILPPALQKADAKASAKEKLKIKEANTKLLEEERRLFYVAVTRARDELIILSYDDYKSDFVTKYFEVPKGVPAAPLPQRPPKPPIFIPEFRAGMRVRHSSYGEGIVKSVDDEEFIKVDFGDKGVRTFKISTVCQSNLIKTIK